MSIPSKISAYLESNNFEYSHIQHSPAFSAEEVAHQVHCPRHEMAKIIVVKVDGENTMLVIRIAINLPNIPNSK